MNVAPAAAYELVVDWGSSGAVLGARVIDNQGATTVARVTGFSEYPPGSGVYQRAGNVAPDTQGQYTVVYDDDGGVAAAGHVATDELTVTYSAPGPPVPTGGAYVDIAELQRILDKTTPTVAETAAMERVLAIAKTEIDWDLGYTADNPAPGYALPLLAEVNLERAAELWRFSRTTSGVLPQSPADAPIFAPRDTWHRHHLRLGPLRMHVGVA